MTSGVGTATAKGAAVIAALGNGLTATVGTVTAFGAAKAQPTGVAMAAAVGAATATGDPVIVITTGGGSSWRPHRYASWSEPPRFVSIDAVASPAGVGMVCQVGHAHAQAVISAAPAGLPMMMSVGEAVATGTKQLTEEALAIILLLAA
jgi:hypothetical protein